MPKTSRPAEDRRLTRLAKICLALPEATRRDMGQHAGFAVRKKTFAYFLKDHHGDGIVSVACKALPGENAALEAAQPKRFYLPAYIGPRGWIALRLDVGKTDWQEVRELITVSHRLIASRPVVETDLTSPAWELCRPTVWRDYTRNAPFKPIAGGWSTAQG